MLIRHLLNKYVKEVRANMQQFKRLRSDGPVNAVAWDSSGSYLAILSQFGSRITVFSAGDWNRKYQLEPDTNAYSQNSFVFLSDGRFITSAARLSADNPRSLTVWNAQTGKAEGYFPAELGTRSSKPALVFTSTRDQSKIAAINGALSRDIILFDAASRRSLGEFNIPGSLRETGYLASLAFSHNGKQLAAGTGAGEVFIFDVLTGHLLNSFTAYSSGKFRCSAIVYSPDDEFIAIGRKKSVNIGYTNTISVDVWRQDTGVLINSLEGETIPLGEDRETTGVSSLSWSVESGRLAIGDSISLRVWEHPAARPELVLSQKFPIAYSVSFSKGGILAVGGANGVSLFK